MSTAPLLRSSSIERSDKICYEPSGDSSEDDQDYLIFHIPGNPGLIPYYQPFLSKLHNLLVSSSSTASARFHICGHSLKGFEFTNNGQPPQSPLSLNDQIEYQEDLLYSHVNSHRQRTGNTPKVILMGHSVGAYILLELIRHHGKKIDESQDEDFDLIGGILLFPTITHIAKSPLGMVASKVLNIPYLPVIMGALAKSLSSLLPVKLFYRLVKLATKFPDYAAQTTASFIRSPMGVKQALHLAKDEMHTITDDNWDKEVWGAAMSEGTNSRDTIHSNLTMYWGRKDRWVADHTRDALIDARGQRSDNQNGSQTEIWKPVMLIDKESMPHDFCTTLRNSNIVAEKVKTWVDGIIHAHMKVVS